MTPHPTSPLPFEERPSRSDRKRQAQDLQVLGGKLAALPASRLKVMAVPDRLQGALDELARTRSFEGRRRQLQYIGKVMTLLDEADIEALRHGVEQFELGLAHDSLRLHQAELWRERLLRDDNALPLWLEEHPGTDVQHLRSLIRSARQQAAATPDAAPPGTADRKGHTPRHGKAYRELFALVRDQLGSSSSGD
ncbi:ribosome biogenesis factor YjgA [Amphibiibacter pelophylacis]|uniref:Ribosome biogenesis factor YjgA n=1 Tax=Amphibiibacter pelophylacis TaxID=1799477 RepID=A0ACC6P4K7_9BURK